MQTIDDLPEAPEYTTEGEAPENNTTDKEQTQDVLNSTTEQAYATEQEETPAEKNWREMRQMMRELKEQNTYLQQQLSQTQHARVGKTTSQTSDEDDEELLTRADLKRELEQYKKQQETASIPQKLAQQYPDYNQVVNQDNILKLVQDDPETAQDIEALQSDPLRMSRLLYKTLKHKYGINIKEAEESMSKKEHPLPKEKTPSSSSAVPKRSALSEANAFANGLTPELKKRLWQEMNEAERYH